MPCFYLHLVCEIGSPYTSNITLNVYFHTTSIYSIFVWKLVQIVFIYIIAPSVSSFKLYLMQYDSTRKHHILYMITAYLTIYRHKFYRMIYDLKWYHSSLLGHPHIFVWPLGFTFLYDLPFLNKISVQFCYFCPTHLLCVRLFTSSTVVPKKVFMAVLKHNILYIFWHNNNNKSSL